MSLKDLAKCIGVEIISITEQLLQYDNDAYELNEVEIQFNNKKNLFLDALGREVFLLEKVS